ncbi:MAG: MATE family efflux transporter [Theionarchaea archaeon]|nr:MATE family efflux transporter [Theionarchaea archaeon]MBU7036914.1 MATE family efflux transporter [Theionarchaea archaeon]
MERTDFTEMDISQAIRHIALPSILGMFFGTLYNIVDIFWVGRLGYQQIAAVALFGIFFEFVIVFNEVVGVGSVALIARHYGARNFQRVNEVVKQTLFLKLMIAAIFCVTGVVLVEPIIVALGGSGDVIEYGVAYGRVMSVGFLFMLSGFTLFTAMRGVGDARTPMKIMIVSNLMNMVLDPVFIFGLNLGVTGAAAASVVSQLVSFAIGLSVITAGNHVVTIDTKLEFDFKTMKTILTVGLPSGAEALMRNISSMVAIRIISAFGMAVLAGMEIMLRLMGLVWMPLMGLNLACGTLVGHNLGAKKPDQAEKTALKAGYMGAAIMVGIAVLFLVFSTQLVTLFNRTESVVQAGTSAFRIVSPFLIFLGFSMPLSGAFYGSGDTKPPMIITFLTFLLFQIPMMVFMSRVLGFAGVFWAYGLSMLGMCVLMVTWFFRGKWKERKLE